MNASHDNVLVPPLHDTLSDAGTGGAGFRDEQPDDASPRHDTDDPQYVADMQARESMREQGFVDALCLGCGCPLFVHENDRRGDALCAQCQSTGDALAAEEEGRPCALCGGGPDDPRHGGGFHSSEVPNQHEYEPAGDDSTPGGRFAALAQYPNAALIDAVAAVDGARCSGEWVGVDATGGAPDEAHPTIPGYVLKTEADKAAFLAAAAEELCRRLRRVAA